MLDEHVRGRPAARLRPWVPFYSGYRQDGVPPALHRGLPSPYLTLIFTLDDPLVIARHPDPGQAAGAYDSLAGGLHLAPALITHPGRQSGVQVTVSPLGCRALFGRPAAELVNQDVDAAELLGRHVVDEVRHRLLTASGWAGRFAVVDDVLGRIARDQQGAPELTYAYRRIAGRGVSVAALAAEIGWSGRHLTGRFRAEFGLRPKEAARVARFDRARRTLRPAARLADVAAAHGFADQSHLVREFHAFAGCTPSRWIADEFGFVQSLGGADADDGWHDH